MALPIFAELAGDTEPRLIEASRLFRAVPAMREQGAEGAKQALIGATDAAAREAALRWLEAQATRGLAMAEMVEGPREDADDTAAWMRAVAHLLIGPELTAYLDGSPMARDPDWPATGKVAMALADPTMRGEATRLLRDMWWRAMQAAQIEARKKPGAFLASVGITAAHVAEIVLEGVHSAATATSRTDAEFQAAVAPARSAYAEAVLAEGGETAALVNDAGQVTTAWKITRNDSAEPLRIETAQGPLNLPAGASVVLPGETATLGELAGTAHDAGQEAVLTLAPREHPPMPPRRGPQPPLPGGRRAPPDAKEIADAIKALGKTDIAKAEGLVDSLGISTSTWNNWLAGRNVPRVDVHKARVLSAEIAKIIADLEQVDAVLRRVIQ